MQTQTFERGANIITKGDQAITAYQVITGKVRVYLDRDGKSVTLAELGPGAIFGETALFGNHQYGANVYAMENTELRLITPESFQEKLGSCDPMLKAIIGMLIERQRKTNEKLLNSETREFMDIALV